MRLKQLRVERNISQVRLAMELSVSQHTISRYETGEREADYTMLIRIADYFDVSLDYLLERTDNPEINK
jgi:transcriptional regulator with XRE-family HTH domain